MPASRCSLCGISFPYGYGSCLACGGKLDGIGDAQPDDDYEEQAQRLRAEEPLTHDERELRDWRRDELVRAGFDLEDADILAARTDVDLRLACVMVARGCPPATALYILL